MLEQVPRNLVKYGAATLCLYSCSCFSTQRQVLVCSDTMRHIQPQSYHVGIWRKFATRWTQSTGRCNLARTSQPGTQRSPRTCMARGHKIAPAAKNFRISGAKKRDQKVRNMDPEIGTKTNPWRPLGYYKYKEGQFLGTVFWTPKMCSKAWFSGSFSGGFDFTRNA